jgi:hypothetical protein
MQKSTLTHTHATPMQQRCKRASNSIDATMMQQDPVQARDGNRSSEARQEPEGKPKVERQNQGHGIA